MANRRYAVNDGNRTEAVRVGMEKELKQFIRDYKKDMGTSESAACRRLILIGARCEAEHGNTRMPASYGKLFYDPEERLRDSDNSAYDILDEGESLKSKEPIDWTVEDDA